MTMLSKHVTLFVFLIIVIFTTSAGTCIQIRYLSRQAARIQELHTVLDRLGENQNNLLRDSRTILEEVRKPPPTNSYLSVRTFVLYSQADTINEGTIVLLGDSIVDSLYAPLLGERKTWNAAVAGVGARYYAEHARRLLQKARPAIVIVALGINDCCMHPYESQEDTSQWLHFYKSIVSAIRSVDAVPVLVTILPVEDNRPLGTSYFSQTRIRSLNECIRHLAEEEELALIDAYAKFAAGETMPVGGTVDGVHLTTHSSTMLKGELERGVATAEAQIKNKKRRRSP